MEVNTLQKEKSNELKIYLVYVILFFIFVFKMFFYASENFGTPDSTAQLSYVVYMELHPEVWNPDYSDIMMYERVSGYTNNGQRIYQLEETDVTCYMGHPPLYYKLMSFCDCVFTDNGEIYLNYTKLRICNALLTAFTMLLVMLVGYKLLKKNNSEWYLHLLFFSIATSLPQYGYLGAGVNNDNLCNLGIVVVWMGLISYVEKGYCYKTFWLMAIGLAISVFAKLTTGFMVLVATVIMIVIDIVKTKKLGIVFNKYFATTLPIYAIILHFFFSLYAKYGTFQPSYSKFAPKEDVEASIFYVPVGTGHKISFLGDIEHFFGGIWDTWMSVYDSSFVFYREGIFGVAYAVCLLLFFVAMIIEAVSYFKGKGKNNNVVILALGVGVLAALLVHFKNHYNKHSVGGYAGGVQGRYYVCSVPIIAMGVTQVIMLVKQKCHGYVEKIGKYVVVAFAIWMIYLDFFYFISNIYLVL